MWENVVERGQLRVDEDERGRTGLTWGRRGSMRYKVANSNYTAVERS